MPRALLKLQCVQSVAFERRMKHTRQEQYDDDVLMSVSLARDAWCWGNVVWLTRSPCPAANG